MRKSKVCYCYICKRAIRVTEIETMSVVKVKLPDNENGVESYVCAKHVHTADVLL